MCWMERKLYHFITGLSGRIPRFGAKKHRRMRGIANRSEVTKMLEAQWFSKILDCFHERPDKDEVTSSNLVGPISHELKTDRPRGRSMQRTSPCSCRSQVPGTSACNFFTWLSGIG